MLILWLFLLSLLLFLPLFNPVDGLNCHKLPKEHRHNQDITIDWTLFQTENCSRNTEDDDPVYACVTRVDRGEVRMGCLEKNDNESISLCKNAIEDAEEKCNYLANRPFGIGHPFPGHGICCCPSNGCNNAPPYWLLSRHGEDQFDLLWRYDIDRICCLFVLHSILMVLFALEGLIEGKITLWWSKRQKNTKKKTSSHSYEFEHFPTVTDFDETEHPSNETSKAAVPANRVKKFSQKPAENLTSGRLNATQSSHRIPELPLDETPKDTTPAAKSSFVLDGTQKTTTLVKGKKSSRTKKSVMPLAKAKKSSQLGKKSAAKTSGKTAAPNRISLTDVTQEMQENPDGKEEIR